MFTIRHQLVGGVPQVVVERDGATWTTRSLLGREVAIEDVFADWDGFLADVERALEQAPTDERVEGEYLVPTVSRPAVFCAGANFADHVAEMGEQPVVRAYHFISPPTALSAHGGTVHRPVDSPQLDWEVELVAVIGRRTWRASEADALGAIAAYTVGNDISVRGTHLNHPIFGVDWGMAKNGDGLTAIGPALVPTKFVGDPQHLRLSLTVNDAVRQDSSTDQMLVSVAAQIAALSSRTTLNPGDIILTGTPAGTARAHDNAYLQDGDVLTARIEGVGELTSTIAPTLP